jgi:hypothetical protein
MHSGQALKLYAIPHLERPRGQIKQYLVWSSNLRLQNPDFIFWLVRILALYVVANFHDQLWIQSKQLVPTTGVQKNQLHFPLPLLRN